MDENPRRVVGSITLSMFGIGVGIALVAVLTGAWISATIVPDLGAAEEEVVTSYTPLAFLSITALAAPVIAGVLGVVKSDVSETTRDAAIVGLACLVGAALMVMVAGVGIAFSEPTGPQEVNSGDGGDGNGGDNSGDGGGGDSNGGGTPTVLDLVGLAGLCGAGALISGFVTARFSAT
jgi:uncharacterized membrane protein YgcG